MKQVVVYHQPGCEACREAMEHLTRRGVPFVSRNIQEDRAALQELIRMRRTSTPSPRSALRPSPTGSGTSIASSTGSSGPSSSARTKTTSSSSCPTTGTSHARARFR